MIGIIDIGMGNLQSVCRACEHVGAQVVIASTPNDLERCRAIILPGVGAFGDGIRQLREKGFDEALHKQVKAGKPVLGICLGMQLLAEVSEEHGIHRGLGLIKGNVVRLRPSHRGERVPHVGWSDVFIKKRDSALWQGISSEVPFYFTHSYTLVCAIETDVAATFLFGGTALTAAVERDNLFGVQFHPEKSQDVGLELLHNFWMLSRH